MVNRRNSYIIGKALKNFLLASVLTMAVQQLNVTVDGIIVGNFVNPDAFAATSLFMPLSLAISSFGALFGIGATIIAARHIGELDREKTDRTLSTAVLAVLVFGILLGAVSLLTKDSISSLVCHEERLEGHFTSYMSIMMGCSVITMLSTLTNHMISIDGHPEYVIAAVSASAVTNLILDIVFVAFAGWGIAGSAWATVISTLCGIIYLWKYIMSSRCLFSIRPFRYFSFSNLKNNMKHGASIAISNLLLMALYATQSNIVQDRQGADGMFAFAICLNLLTLGMSMTTGVVAPLMSIGGFLNGQHDYVGLKMLVHRGIALLEISIFTVVAVIQLFPGLISTLFGADTVELKLYSSTVLRTFSWFLPCVMSVLLLSNVYQLLGKLILVPVIALMTFLVLISSLLLWSYLAGDERIWYAFPQTGLTLLSAVLVISQIIRRKEPDREWLTLVPHAESGRKIDISVKADTKAMAGSMAEISDFLLSSGLEKKLCNDINLCVEEVVVNVVEHSGHNRDNHYFDVSINLQKHCVTASIKDDGKPFDPVRCSESQKGMGLKILHALCPDIEYRYMYGLNMIFMQWNISEGVPD